MPELPEVETTRRGISPKLKHQTINRVVINHYQLRWPIPSDLPDLLTGQSVISVKRRAKYLLLTVPNGTVIIHLGMSGHLKFVDAHMPYQKHDHVGLELTNGLCLRYHDPRRFGAWLWTAAKPEQHPLLCSLGPEPLSQAFNTDYLHHALAKKTAAIKQVIMNSKVVVGVGNIYANEALFQANIAPHSPANTLAPQQVAVLITVIKQVLTQAIAQGGTTLKDFINSDGKPGYFKQQLQVYGRGQQPCTICTTLLVETRLGQRSTVYCPTCQPDSQ